MAIRGGIAPVLAMHPTLHDFMADRCAEGYNEGRVYEAETFRRSET